MQAYLLKCSFNLSLFAVTAELGPALPYRFQNVLPHQSMGPGLRHAGTTSKPCLHLALDSRTHLELSALSPATESRRVSARSVPSVQRATSTASRAKTAGLKMLRARPPMTTSTVRMTTASWNHSYRQQSAGVKAGSCLELPSQQALPSAGASLCSMCRGQVSGHAPRPSRSMRLQRVQ